MSNDSNNVLEIQSDGLFFLFYYLHPLKDWVELKGPYRNRFMKTPEDLIQSLNKLEWSDDVHRAHILTMSTYMELKVPKYGRDQDLCISKLYSESTRKIVVVKEDKLATMKELCTDEWNIKNKLTSANQDKSASEHFGSIISFGSDELIVHKDDLHEMLPDKTDTISPKILDLFYPKILFVNNVKSNTK